MSTTLTPSSSRAACALAIFATFPSVPSELYKALGIEKSATPKELHEAVTKRYNDPAQGAGKVLMLNIGNRFQ